jgi:hypothetical protein
LSTIYNNNLNQRYNTNLSVFFYRSQLLFQTLQSGKKLTNMQLLDLPPEIFQRIIGVLVKKHGLKDAWKLRGTSSKNRTRPTALIQD